MTHRYLMRRGNAYYARLFLSKTDQLLLGRKEIWRSLGIITQKEAVEKLALLHYKFASDKVGFMSSKRDYLGTNELRLLAAEYENRAYNQLILDGESEFYQFSGERWEEWHDPFMDEEDLKKGPTLDELPDLTPKNTLGEFIGKLDARLKQRQKEIAYAAYDHAEKLADKIADELKGHTLPNKDSDKHEGYTRSEFLVSLLKAEIVAIERYKKAFEASDTGHLTRGQWTNYNEILSDKSTKAHTKRDSRTFGDLIVAFNAAPENGGRSVEMAQNIRGYQNLLLDIIKPDTPVDTINDDTVREVFVALNTLPKNATKKYQGKTYREVFEIERDKPSDLEKLSAKTKSDYFQHMGTIFNWAVAGKWMVVNPITSSFRFKDESLGDDARAPFSDQDLKVIFSDNFFQGAKRAIPLVYWVPTIALFTGMRLAEVLMLSTDEVAKEKGIDYFSLRPTKARRVKTAQSARDIPIPDILIKLGFLDYVEQRRKAKEDMLFPASQKNPVDAYGKVFARMLTRLGITRTDKVFHSFRHNYRDGIRQAELNPADAQIAHGLGGWSSSEVHERYGSGYTLAQKKRVIELITGKGMVAACKIALQYDGKVAAPVKPRRKAFKKAPVKR